MKFIPLLLIFCCSLPVHAAKTKGFDLDGRVGIEFGADDGFRYGSVEREGILELKTPRHSGARAVTELQLSSNSGGVEVRELFIDFKSAANHRWTIGQAKKRFGLQFDQGSQSRLAFSRGVIYRKLGEHGYIGRDTTIGWGMNTDWRWNFSHDVSIHSSDGLTAAALYQLKWELGQNEALFAYSLFHSDVYDKQWIPGGAQAIAYQKILGWLRYEGEVMFGKDIIQTEYLDRLGYEGSIYFSAASFGAAVRWKDIEPFARVSALFHDMSRFANRTTELTMGSKYHFTENFQGGIEINLTNSSGGAPQKIEGLKDEALDSASNVLIALRYYF